MAARGRNAIVGVLWALTVWVSVSGCTAARREVETDIVRDIHFTGNGGFLSGNNDYQLRIAMEQAASPLLTLTFPFHYFITPKTLNVEAMQRDGSRLEIWYAHHGWFDAKFMGWQIRRVRMANDRRAGVVDVFGYVEPGTRSNVASFIVRGLDGRRATSLLARTALRRAAIGVGDPFDLALVRESQGILLDILRNKSYAYATVGARMDAYPERKEVEVELVADPGIRARFGKVSVSGNEQIDERSVRHVLTFKRGQAYEIDRLRLSQRRLFETGLFSVVDINPDLSDPTQPDVPIRIFVDETKFRRLRVGAGIEYESTRLSPHTTASIRDVNFLGTRLVNETTLGVGFVIDPQQIDAGVFDASRFSFRAREKLSYPWLARRKLPITFEAGVEQRIQFGNLPIQRADANANVAYRFSEHHTLGVGPTFEFFRFIDDTEQTRQASRSLFGGDFNDISYRLFTIDGRFIVDHRDDPIATRRGSYWALSLRQSLPVAASDFLYGRAMGEVRLYRPVRINKRRRAFPWVLSGRARAIAVGQWDANAADGGNGLPWPDLAFLGGPNSLRGFRTEQVGPYQGVCLYENERPVPGHNNGERYGLRNLYLPLGGVFGAEVLAEARYDWRFDLSFAFFGEVGMLMNRWTDFEVWQNAAALREAGETVDLGLRYGGGFGVRYATPIGPLRIDLGFRPLFPEDLEPERFIGCNNVDRVPRAFDLFSAGFDTRVDVANRHPGVAVNLFIALGEAF